MPTVREIEEALYRFAPRETAMEWDNVGLLAGFPEREVRRVLVALDVTRSVAEEAVREDCALIVAHHPVMNCRWDPVQSVREDTPLGGLLITLLRGGVSCICMHTNLDRAEGGVNDCLAAALGLQEVTLLPGGDEVCRVGRLPEPLPLERFARAAAAALETPAVRFADAGRPVYRVAVGGGACGEYAAAARAAGCDTFVTADLKYHAFLDETARGLNLIDAGHFPTENPVCTALTARLQEDFPDLDVLRSQVHRDVIQYAVCP